MKKRVIVLAFMLLFFSAFVSAEIQITKNDSLVNTNYTLGSSLSGLMNISIKNVPAKAIITSSLGGNISLRDFIKANGQQLSCETFNCSSTYSASSGSTSRSFIYPNEKFFGFQITDKKNVQIKSVKFNITSNFQLSDTLPLSLKFFENYDWKFDDASGQFDRFQSLGCYDPSAPVVETAKISTTKYCEKVSNLPSATTYKLGANITGSGSTKMFMSINGVSFNEKNCEFDASLVKDCTIKLPEALPAGEYLICINAENNNLAYSFNTENSAPTCGSYNNEEAGRDYPLSITVPKYSSANVLNNAGIPKSDFDNMVFQANENYIKPKYSSDCSINGGCVLPVEISGIGQTIQISNIQISYSATGGEFTSDKVYSLSTTPVLVDFNGTIDLEKLGFALNSVGNKSLVISIDGAELLKKNIQVVSAPIINSLTPLTPLAGVPTNFVVNVSSALNISGYRWDFGDGKVENTTQNTVSHIYTNNTLYNLQVFVTDSNGVTASKNFTIVSGNPSEIVGVLITAKKNKLEKFSASLSGYPTWQADAISKTVKLQESMDIVKAMEQKKNTIFADADYIKLALDLNALIIPQGVYVIKESSTPFLVNEEDVDPSFISELSSDSDDEDVSGYKKGIAQWERENIKGLIVEKRLGVLMENGVSTPIGIIYSINADSIASEESYFILNKDYSQFITDGTFDFKDGKTFSYFVFAPESQNSFEFMFPSSTEQLKIYVSPDTKNLPYDAPLGVCNFNLVCEPNKLNPSLGETYENCRTDCKPVAKTLYWIILIIIATLAVYTLLQIWYKRRYEKALFNDRAQLFNLVSYIDSMRNRNVPEGLIRNKLAEQGWSGEQINYAVKKSKGQNTGMYELIPVEKILYLLRDRKSKVEAKSNPVLVPAVPRRMPPVQNTNFNKAQNPNSNVKRW